MPQELDEITRRVDAARDRGGGAAEGEGPGEQGAPRGAAQGAGRPACQRGRDDAPSGRPSARRSSRVQALREELEQVRRDIEEAERNYDLNRAAELRHGKLPELERRAEGRGGAAGGEAGRRAAAPRGGHRGGDRRDRRALDGHPGRAAARGRAREAAAARRDPPRARRRPGRGGAARRRRDHSRARRSERPAPADRLVHLPGADGRREDGARKTLAEALFDSEEAIIRLDMSRVPGAAHRLAPGRRAARLRRLRGGRSAHRGGAAPALLGRALRRDREGARGRLQHAPAGARRRPADRCAGPHGRLPQHGDHHDLEHRLAVPARGSDERRRDRRGRARARAWQSCARTSGPSS